ncbi:hypothetical protein KAS41_02625 [Candidatus Parcubacteria bacterium]|nr:hypothetical protein [Candidatus Parcubacteria bacterium]
MNWINLFHIYQPPDQTPEILKQVARQSYIPLFRFLKANPQIKITLNINASLSEQLQKQKLNSIIKNIRILAERGQIEFTGSAAYHPILPFLNKSEIIRQIELNYKINKKIFGDCYQPKGFFLPELCYNIKAAKIISQLGYRWIVLDEIAYNGRLGEAVFNKTYKIKGTSLRTVFRNRNISNLFFFNYIKNELDFFQEIEKDKRCRNNLITVTDGENLGHHHPRMMKIWQKAVLQKGVKAIQVSELLESYKKVKKIEPLQSSWATSAKNIRNKNFYPLWKNPNNGVHQLQWKLLKLAADVVKNLSKKSSEYKRAILQFDKNCLSCQFWWAAASPWWDAGFVEFRAKKNLDFINRYSANSKINRKAKNLYKQIVKTAKEWEKSGRIKKIQDACLAGEPYQIYFSGKKLK